MELELVLKMPAKKPPVICILFKDRYGDLQAAKTNEYWVNHFKEFEYTLILEPKEKWIDIRLQNKILHCDYLYTGVKYNPEVLKRFLHLNQGQLFNFAHIFNADNAHKVAFTTEKRAVFVLKIKKVIGPGEQEF